MIQKPDVPDESTELYEHFRFVVDKGQAITRVDKYLVNSHCCECGELHELLG